MRKDVVDKSVLAVAGMLVAASMAFAKSPNLDLGRSSQKSADIAIYSMTRISGGPALQSGEYKVVLTNNSPTPEIGFYQNGKLVVQVPAKLVDQGKEFGETAFYYDAKGASLAISEMDLSGWEEAVLFGPNDSDAGSKK